jgi:hypothetical protein
MSYTVPDSGVANLPPIPGTSIEDQLSLLGLGYEVIPIHAKNKACYAPRWTEGTITPSRLNGMKEHHPDHASTGCRTGKFAVADNDLLNPEHAAAVSEAIQAILGLCAYVRIGGKPGGALCYHNPDPIGKITVTGRAPGARPTDKPERVEFLGKGQQLVTHGFHHGKGADYEWPEYDLFDSKIEDLPTVTPDMIRDAALAVRDTLVERGFTDVSVTGTGLNVNLSSRASEGLTPVAPEWLVDMFHTDGVGEDCDRLEWIGWLCVWKYTPLVDAETGEPFEDFDRLAAFDEWSALGDRGNYEGGDDCLKAWLSFSEADARTNGKTIASLVHEAVENGYTGPTYWSPHAAPKTPAIERLRGMAAEVERPKSRFKNVTRGARRPRVQKIGRVR